MGLFHFVLDLLHTIPALWELRIVLFVGLFFVFRWIWRNREQFNDEEIEHERKKFREKKSYLQHHDE